MTIPAIRCATTPEGNIEACSFNRDSPRYPYRLVVDRRSGDVLEANVQLGTDMYRWLARAARNHVAL